MRVRLRDLALWSFLMSTAHGAGLMLLPVLATHGRAAHGPLDGGGRDVARAVGLAAVHTVAMLAMMAAVASWSTRRWASASCAAPGSTSTGSGPRRW